MPVSPDGARAYAQTVAALYADAAAQLNAIVARRLARGITDPGWAEAKLAQVTALRDEAQATARSLSPRLRDAVGQLMADAYRAGVERAGGPPLPGGADTLLGTNRAAVEAYAVALQGTLQQTNTRILRSAEDVYRRVVADVAGQGVTGVLPRREVAARAVARFTGQGVTGFVDRAGRNWELGSYVEMAARTSMGQAHVQGGLDRYQQQGRYLVVVSDSPENCDLCAPFERRALSITGRAPTEVELGGHVYAGTLREARSQGLLHPNCTHALSALTPGLTRVKAPVDDPELYRTRQRQRTLERTVRESKQRVQAVEAFGDTATLAKERALLRKRREALRSFNTENDRKAYVSQRRVSLTSR